MKVYFGDIVVVDEDQIGVVVKSWLPSKGEAYHEVYVRSYHKIQDYKESQIERYCVRHKELSEEEKEYQFNGINNL